MEIRRGEEEEETESAAITADPEWYSAITEARKIGGERERGRGREKDKRLGREMEGRASGHLTDTAKQLKSRAKTLLRE